MRMFTPGPVTLSSGKESSWKFDFDAVPDAELPGVAKMIRQLVGPFRTVSGVPRGGVRLADALEPYRQVHAANPHLIVDDVLTTGRSMNKARREFLDACDHVHVIGAVFVARGPCPPWVSPLMTVNPWVW